MTTLWDTNSGEVVKALTAERRAAGAVASGLVLTLVAVVDERSVPGRLRGRHGRLDDPPLPSADRRAAPARCAPSRGSTPRSPSADTSGPGESVVLRVYGRLANHAESVVLPLLASDTPVVTWWYGEPPQRTGLDPLGELASRRITDAAAAPDPLAALRQRAIDYEIGDTDLVWTRLTSWRALLASSFDSVTATPRSGSSSARPRTASPRPGCWRAWLGSRLGVPAVVVPARWPGHQRGHHRARQRHRCASTAPTGCSATLSSARARPSASCRCRSATSASCWPRSCAGSTPTSPTPTRWLPSRAVR